MTKVKEGVGSSVEETTTYAFDALGRMTAKEVGGSTCSRTPAIVGPDTAFHYDAVPSGETCPISGGCTNPKDRLVLATFEVKCNGTSPDLGKFWLAYDKVGRTTAEHRVALGRTDVMPYSYDKNSNPTGFTLPSLYGIVFTYGGGSGDNSDSDDLTRVTLASTDWLTSVAWHPSGPTKSWTQANKKGSVNLAFTDTRNAAMRNTRIEVKSGTTEYLDLVYDEDSRGRYSKKDNDTTNADPTDSFYKYDPKSRLTCDAKASGSSCPGSGDSNLKSNIAYDSADNRSSIVFSNPKVSDTHTYAYEAGTNKLADITKADTYKIDYGYNARGMRTVDDDLERSNDTRNFAYYPSGALASITGKTPSSGGSFHDYVMAQVPDHEGRRIFKSVKNTTTGSERQWYFTHDLQGHLVEVRRIDDVNTSTCTGQTDLFLWVGQKPFAKYVITWIPSGQNCNVNTVGRHFLSTDHLGTPMVLTSWPTTGDTAISWSASYDAFGWAHPSDETFYQPFRFPGQHADPETEAKYWDGSAYKLIRPGETDNHHRSYDALNGAYVTADPIGILDGENHLFVYASSDAVGRTDATGLCHDGVGHDGEPCPQFSPCAEVGLYDTREKCAAASKGQPFSCLEGSVPCASVSVLTDDGGSETCYALCGSPSPGWYTDAASKYDPDWETKLELKSGPLPLPPPPRPWTPDDKTGGSSRLVRGQ